MCVRAGLTLRMLESVQCSPFGGGTTMSERGVRRRRTRKPRLQQYLSYDDEVLAVEPVCPTHERFTQELQSVLAEARNRGDQSVDVRSGDLHRRTGGYPQRRHRLPTCCRVMYEFMRPQDEIIKRPPKGNGANLVIRYHLPR